jgi:hypothetical protein
MFRVSDPLLLGCWCRVTIPLRLGLGFRVLNRCFSSRAMSVVLFVSWCERCAYRSDLVHLALGDLMGVFFHCSFTTGSRGLFCTVGLVQ